jgi:acetoin utilization deacetylase AcuC-like enzyme
LNEILERKTMAENLYVVHSGDHQGHRPQTFFNFGEMQDNLEKPERIEAIRATLASLPAVRVHESERHATFDELCAVHTPELVRFLTERMVAWDPEWPDEIVPGLFPYSFSNAKVPDWPLAQASYFCFDAGTPIGPKTVQAATAAAGCALQAAEAVASGASALAYALCRPPGHHATRARYGGFCYFNNAALAAGRLASLGRVAVLDIDFHHGNGTQEITYRSDRVMYVSIHGDPNDSYPFFCGYAEERGEDAGEGYNLNLPLARGSGLAAYQPALQRALDAITGNDCRALVVSAGFDTCEGDPLGGFSLQPEDFQPIGEAITSLGLPTVVVQEGGYVVDLLGQCAQALVTGLRG